MKKMVRQVISVVAACIMAVITSVGAFAECDSSDFIASFDELVEELTCITAELGILESKNLNGEYAEEIKNKEQDISYIKNLLKAQGANTFDDRLMCEIVTNADYSNTIIGKSTPDLSSLTSRLNQMYDAYGKQSTYYDGSKNYKVYEIYVMHSNSKKNGIALERVTTNHILYDKINADSSEASQWINEIISIYVSKGISSVLEALNPVVKYLPYEIFFSSKPTASQISSPGAAMALTLNTVTTIKFTYVLDETIDTWKLCLSTNLVSAAFTCTECLSVNGKAINKTKDYPAKSLYGGYTSSVPSAITIFKNMLNNSYISSGNLGLNNVSYKSKYKGSLSHGIPNPSSPLGL